MQRPSYPDGSPMTPEDDAKDLQPRNPDGTPKEIQKLSKHSSRVFSKTPDPELTAKVKDKLTDAVPTHDESKFADFLDLVDE